MQNKTSGMKYLPVVGLVLAVLLLPLITMANTATDEEEETSRQNQPNTNPSVRTNLSTLDELLEILSGLSISRPQTTGRLGIEPAPTPSLRTPTNSRQDDSGTANGASANSGRPNGKGTDASQQTGSPSAGGASGNINVSVGSGRVGVSLEGDNVSVDIRPGGGLFPIFNPLENVGQPSGSNSKPGNDEGSESTGAASGETPAGVGSGLGATESVLAEIIGTLDQQLEDFSRQGKGQRDGNSQNNSEKIAQQGANSGEGGTGNQNGGEDGYYDPNQAQVASTTKRRGQNQRSPRSAPSNSSTGTGGVSGQNRQQTTQKDIEAQVPPDLRGISNDDIVARQLREAATAETDPELKEKLWDEYRKYKNI